MTKMPRSIFDLIDLEDFRTRTAMYIGDRKITALRSFIYGYFYAMSTNGIVVDDQLSFDDFNDWVAAQFKWKESTAGWSNIILHECNGDEKFALDKFFELYDQFKTRAK